MYCTCTCGYVYCTCGYVYCTYVTGCTYLDISISVCGGMYVTEVFDKRDSFNCNIVNFPYMCSNIPAKPTYGVYVSQLIRMSRICHTYSSFVKNIDY